MDKNVKKEEVPVNQEANELQVSEATVAEAPVAEAAPEEAPKAPRDLFYERIRTNFPDANYDEDEAEYYSHALSHMDVLENDSKTLKTLTEKLNARLGEDPDEASIMLDWLDGVDIRTAIVRHKGEEALAVPSEDSDEYANWKQAGEDRKAELAKMKAQVDEYRTNAEASAAALQEYAKENNLSEEQTVELEDYITNVLLPDIYAGKLSKDTYALLQRARNYEADVNGAREQGRIEGRNEKIDLGKKHLKGSGLPHGAAGGNAQDEIVETENKTADWLAKMASRR